jgi:hypothetical protein
MHVGRAKAQTGDAPLWFAGCESIVRVDRLMRPMKSAEPDVDDTVETAFRS